MPRFIVMLVTRHVDEVMVEADSEADARYIAFYHFNDHPDQHDPRIVYSEKLDETIDEYLTSVDRA